jgi:hypothetical protein
VQVDFQKGGIMPGFDGKLESWLSLIPEVWFNANVDIVSYYFLGEW